MPTPWNDHKNRIENVLGTPGVTMAQVVGLPNPVEVEMDVNERERTFFRCGYIDCERWVEKVSEDPCRLVAGHNATPHTATIRMTEEEVQTVSQTMSGRISTSMSLTLGSSVGTQAGIDSTHVSISSTASTTQGLTFEFVSSETIARQIRSARDVAETVGLDAHVPVLCKKWRVPYGIELVLTVRGKVKVRRRWVQSLQDPRKIEWVDNVTVDPSGAQVDASVDPAIDTATSFVEDTRCATCEDGTRLELRDDGKVVQVPGETRGRGEPKSRVHSKKKEDKKRRGK